MIIRFITAVGYEVFSAFPLDSTVQFVSGLKNSINEGAIAFFNFLQSFFKGFASSKVHVTADDNAMNCSKYGFGINEAGLAWVSTRVFRVFFAEIQRIVFANCSKNIEIRTTVFGEIFMKNKWESALLTGFPNFLD